jgi:hypothetical protein
MQLLEYAGRAQQVSATMECYDQQIDQQCTCITVGQDAS